MDRYTALIIDDMLSNRAWLKAALGYDFDYLEADTFEAMKEYMSDSDRIDVIILNLNFHTDRGFEVLTWLNDRKYADKVPVIVIQEHFNQAKMDEAYALGVQDCLYYPLAINQLKHRVHSTINFMERLKKVQYKASHDELTGAINRSAAVEYMMSAMDSETDSEFFMAIIDLDFFKHINDTKGHAFGDKVLVLVHKEIAEYVGKRGIVSRYGGDEFVVFGRLMEDIEEFAGGLEEVITREEDGWPITASIGISTTVESGRDRKQLFKDADAALFYSKGNGRNQFTIYSKKSFRHIIDGSDKDVRGIRSNLDTGFLIRSFSDMFESVYYVNLQNMVSYRLGLQADGSYDMGDPINPLDFLSVLLHKADESCRLEMSEFINVRTLAFRLADRNSISFDMRCKCGDSVKVTYSVCNRDENQNAIAAILYIGRADEKESDNETEESDDVISKAEMDMCALNGLKQHFSSIWLVDPKTLGREVYYIETDVNRFIRINSFFDGGNYFDQFSGYIRKYVVPEHQDRLIHILSPEVLFDSIPKKGTMVVPFDRTTDGVMCHCEYVISWGEYNNRKVAVVGYRRT